MRAVGLDLGGTALKGGAVEFAMDNGHVAALAGGAGPAVESRFLDLRLPEEATRPDGLEALLDHFHRGFEQAVAPADWSASDVQSLGVGLPGTTDSKRGVCTNAPALPCLNDVPIRAMLQDRLGLDVPIALGNDVNVATLGELRLGAGRGHQSVVMIALGKGVGGGVAVNGELWEGAHGFAGEIGHLPLEKDGRPCECGKWGCFEQYVGTAEIAALARQKLAGGHPSLMRELVAGDLRKVEPETVGRAAERGDPLALEVWDEVAEVIGRALTCAILLLDPDAVIVGGGVAKAGEPLFARIRQAVRTRCMNSAFDVANIVPAQLGQWAGTYGNAIAGAELAVRGQGA